MCDRFSDYERNKGLATERGLKSIEKYFTTCGNLYVAPTQEILMGISAGLSSLIDTEDHSSCTCTILNFSRNSLKILNNALKRNKIWYLQFIL